MKQKNADTGDLIRPAARDPVLRTLRHELAEYSSGTMRTAGEALAVAGHVFGGDRVRGTSSAQNGSDESVAVAVLLRIAAQLLKGATELLDTANHYASAALIRQLVEVEYLAWAFDTRHGDGERWLRSTKKERQEFFRPARLREAADGRFRGKDYGHHCELGGHPVPGGSVLLGSDAGVYGELLLADALGHTGRTWNHIVGWARQMELHGRVVSEASSEMTRRDREWRDADPLAALPEESDS